MAHNRAVQLPDSQPRSVWQRIRAWARRIQRDAVTLWFAYRDERTPLATKLLCIAVVAYALSPIDLIPDFIPVLGYLDDLLLLPGLIWLAVKLLPPPVVEDSRAKALAWMADQGRKPTSRLGAAAIVLVWLGAAYAGWVWWSR